MILEGEVVILSADTLPACICDHDFWNGINFHFPDCPKHQPVEDLDRAFRGLMILLGAVRLHRPSMMDGKWWCEYHGFNCAYLKNMPS